MPRKRLTLKQKRAKAWRTLLSWTAADVHRFNATSASLLVSTECRVTEARAALRTLMQLKFGSVRGLASWEQLVADEINADRTLGKLYFTNVKAAVAQGFTRAQRVARKLHAGSANA